MKFIATWNQKIVRMLEIEADSFEAASALVVKPDTVSKFETVTTSSDVQLDAVESNNGPQPDRA